jgi:uncharacterized membrane protein YebE (DUF533 family)
MAANDVEAAEKKLKEIIAAALEDGNIDDDEQRAIDEATRDLEKLKARKAAMDRKNARLQRVVKSVVNNCNKRSATGRQHRRK